MLWTPRSEKKEREEALQALELVFPCGEDHTGADYPHCSPWRTQARVGGFFLKQLQLWRIRAGTGAADKNYSPAPN